MNAPRRTKHLVSLYVSNKPGVLNRIALVFARRGYNIDSLVVSEAQDPAFSHMHVVATGDERTLGQILRQLERLVDVIHAREHAGEGAIQRELALVKVACGADKRAEVMDIARAFRSNVIDLSDATLILQATGTTRKIDALHRMLAPYGVRELVRTGKILITRGGAVT